MEHVHDTTTSKEKQKHNKPAPAAAPAPAQAIDIDAIAAVVQDVGINIETVRGLYEILVKTVNDDNRKVTSLFTALDNYMDSLESVHERLVGLIETMRASTKGGA